jgi:hypothetical protein
MFKRYVLNVCKFHLKQAYNTTKIEMRIKLIVKYVFIDRIPATTAEHQKKGV